MSDWKLDLNMKVGQQFRAAAIEGMEDAADHLKRTSQRLAPLDEGDLAGSAKVTMRTAGRIVAIVSYDTPYAVKQHEWLQQKHAQGRRGKYLEAPMNTEVATMRSLIARAIRRRMA